MQIIYYIVTDNMLGNIWDIDISLGSIYDFTIKILLEKNKIT